MKEPIHTLESYFVKNNKPFLPVNMAIIDDSYEQTTDLHRHNFFQVIFIDQGTAEHTIEYEQPVIMESHCVSVIFPNQLHRITFSPDAKGVILMFDEALFCSDILKNELKAYNHNLYNKLNIISREKINYNQIRKMIHHVTFLFNNITPIRREQIRFYIKILLLELIEDVHEEIQPQKNLPTVNLYARYKELIDNQYAENKTVKEYARQMGITTKRLNTICKIEAKSTALAVIHERLMVEARRLLMFSGISMKEIAFTLGFTSPSAFNRFIFAQTGKTPFELKNSMSQKANEKD